MGTPKEVAFAIVEGVPDVRLRAMMGEWLVYFREEYLGTIEDGRLFLKDTPRSRPHLDGVPLVSPHLGAKPAFMPDVQSAEQLFELFTKIVGRKL